MRRLFPLVAIAALFFSSCNFTGGKRIKGNGKASSQQRAVSDFSGIAITGDMDVYFSTGPGFSAKVEADENLMEYIETEKDGNALRISTRDGYNLRSSSPIKVYVTAPTINDLEVVGSGNFVSQSKITSDRSLKIEVTGSGDVKLAVDAPEVKAQVTGSGDLQVSGNTRKFDAEINGSGNVRGFDLLSEDTHIEISGSGDAEVYASKRLNMEINGSGGIAYKGSPSISQNVSGSGSTRKVE